MPTVLRLATLTFGLLLAAPDARAADNQLTPEQRVRIKAAPRSLGFVRWGEIERENGGRE